MTPRVNLKQAATLDRALTCYERVMKIRETVGQDHFVGVFSYAGMPYDEAEESMCLFAREVVPELKKVGATTRAAAAS